MSSKYMPGLSIKPSQIARYTVIPGILSMKRYRGFFSLNEEVSEQGGSQVDQGKRKLHIRISYTDPLLPHRRKCLVIWEVLQPVPHRRQKGEKKDVTPGCSPTNATVMTPIFSGSRWPDAAALQQKLF